MLFVVLDDDAVVLKNYFTLVNHVACRKVWDVVCILAVLRHKGDDSRTELLLDLVKTLVLVTSAKDDDDKACHASLFKQ